MSATAWGEAAAAQETASPAGWGLLGTCSAAPWGTRKGARRGRVRGKHIKDDGKSDDEEEREKGGLLHCLATPCSALHRRPRETPT